MAPRVFTDADFADSGAAMPAIVPTPAPVSAGPRVFSAGDFIDDSSQPRTWGDTFTNWGQSFARGGSGLVDLVENYNPLSPRFTQNLAYSITGQERPPGLAEYVDANRVKVIGNPDYSNASRTERYIGAGIESLPYALTGGGALPAFGSGVGGEVAKDLGAPPLVGALIGGGLTSLASNTVRSVASKAASSFEKQALNVQRSDVAAANKYAPKGVDKLDEAIAGARERGVIKLGPQSAEDMLARNSEIIKQQGDKVTQLLQNADDLRAAQNEIAVPTFETAKKVISKADAGSQQSLKAQFDKWLNGFAENKWDGSLKGLQAEKQALYQKGYTGLTESKALDRAIAHDLKVTIEKGAEQFGSKELAGAIKAENAIQGEHLTLEKLLIKNKNIESMPQGFSKALRRLFVSPIGGSAVGAYSMLTGNPLPAIVGAAGAVATTKGGQLVLSDLARGVSNVTGSNTSRALMGAALSQGPQTKGSAAQEQKAAPTKAAPQSGPAVSQRQAPAAAQPAPPVQALKAPVLLGSKASKQNVSAYVKSLPPVIQAVIKTESNGNHRAISNAGARGLMQLMPANLKKFGVKDAYDPEQNVQAGAKLIQEEMNRFGDIKLAMAAYNAGSPKVMSAIQRAKSTRWEDISRFLPRETREYVPKFLRNLQAVA